MTAGGAVPGRGARALRRFDPARTSLRAEDGPFVAAYLPAGFPSLAAFPALAAAVAAEADLLEIGVPFSDPMADGVTIQRATRAALVQGASLRWILDAVEALPVRPSYPVYLMSYLNPLLAFGPAALGPAAVAAGVRGLVVPDLPLDEVDVLGPAWDAGLEPVPLCAPTTPGERLARLAAAARGFLYAVTRPGTTGGSADLDPALGAYLDGVRAAATAVPVLAGFGVRTPRQARALCAHADGVVVGTVLVEAIERGEDPAALVRALRAAAREEVVP